MDVRVLGPLQVWDAEQELALGGTRPAALLAMLVLNLNRVVSMDALVDGFWGPNPPDTATSSIHVAVSRLRKALQSPGASTGGVVKRRRPGYLLELDPERVDLPQFERLAREGTELFPAAPHVAAGRFAEALRLWRGPALNEFAGLPFAQAEIPRLTEHRLNVTVARIHADLVLGRHAELIPELEALIARHPLDERLQEQLMLSLYRSGRPADALDAYRRARQTFADELGIDPGRALQKMETAVLAQDPHLDYTPAASLVTLASPADSGSVAAAAALTSVTPSVAAAAPTSAVRAGIWNVPARNPHFTGRGDLLDRLHRWLQSERTLTVQALYGLGGVGKTQLVIEYAHRYADEYDVVWWIDAEQPVLIPDQFLGLATHLGVSTNAVATEVVNKVLTELGDRSRWLLIFDNAEHPTDITDYRPRKGGHILVTSRTPGWGALGGRIEVDVLDRPDTVALLRARIPEMTVETADKLAAELGDLPLAAAQAAGYLEQTGLPPGDYLRRFRSHRVGLLAAGDVLDYQGRVDTTWAISLEQLQQVNPAAVALLEIGAYLAPEPIPLTLFTEHPELLDQPLREAAADTDTLADAVGAMVGYSLARRHPGGYQIHRLLQTVIRGRIPPAQRDDRAAAALELIAAAHPGDPDEPRNWASYGRLAAHVLAASSLGDEYQANRRFLLDTVTYLVNTGDVAARALAGKLHKRWLQTLGPDHPDTLTAAATLTTALVTWSECDAAAAVAEGARHRARRVLGHHHPVTLRLEMNYSYALTFVGRHAELAASQLEPEERSERETTLTEARPASEFTFQGALSAFGPDHPMTLAMSALKAIALASASMNDTATARAECENALIRARSRLGPNHPTTLWLTANLILIFVLEGDAEGARVLGEQTLKRSRHQLGPDHPITLNCSAVVAFGLARAGDPEQARMLAEDTLERCRHSLGPNHPTTLGAAAAVTISLDRLGAKEAARTLQADTLARAQNQLGHEHPITLALKRELEPANTTH